jgi:decaprenylphospho-beta-D-erythro-pentofuranosid-2-ulose 2-reductase
VIDAFGQPQSVVVLGGTSDIATAVLRRLAPDRLRSVVIAARQPDQIELEKKINPPPRVRFGAVRFDARDAESAGAVVARCFEEAGEPVDLVIVAVGELGDPEVDETDPQRVTALMTVNTTWPAAALAAVATRLREQGRGRIVVLSSVAGYRVRRSNFVYGAGKAGLDAFAIGLAESLRETDVTVHVVRPGFVFTKMTEGRKAAPFAVGPDRVADDIADGIAKGRTVIWSPAALKWVIGVLGLLPQGIWRRLPG